MHMIGHYNVSKSFAQPLRFRNYEFFDHTSGERPMFKEFLTAFRHCRDIIRLMHEGAPPFAKGMSMGWFHFPWRILKFFRHHKIRWLEKLLQMVTAR